MLASLERLERNAVALWASDGIMLFDQRFIKLYIYMSALVYAKFVENRQLEMQATHLLKPLVTDSQLKLFPEVLPQHCRSGTG